MRDAYQMKFADGSVLALRYSFKALRWMEKQTGSHFFSDTFRNLGGEYLATGIAAGMLHSAPDITVSKIEAVIERHLDAGGHLPALLDQLIEALKQGGILKRVEGEEVPSMERPTQADSAGS